MKCCIVYLLKSKCGGTIINFKSSLNYLHRSLNYKYGYDVIAYVEPDFDKQVIEELSTTYQYLQFKQITFPPVDFPFLTCTEFSTGYRNMCSFFFNLPFSSDMDGYDYYLRLDSDSFLLNVVGNPFEIMQGRTIGYVSESYDEEYAVVGLWNFIVYYCNKHNIPLDRLSSLNTNGKYNLRLIYNNFELINIRKYRTEEIKQLHQAVNDGGYIYKHRWGDHVLRTFITQLFLSPTDLYRFYNLDYYHSGHCQIGGMIRNYNGQMVTSDFLTVN